MILMNDFESSLTPSFLSGIIDTEKRLKANGELQGSVHSFPYYLKDDQCPDQLLLLCEKNEKLKFDYHKIGMGHIVSDKFLEALKSLKTSKYISKKLTALNVKKDAVIRSDLNYIYFFNEEDLINESLSKLEEDKFGNLVPYSLVLNSDASAYDVFTIHKTYLSGYLFLSDSAVALFKKSGFKGIKLVELENAFKHHCRDYNYDLDLSKKPVKRNLP